MSSMQQFNDYIVGAWLDENFFWKSIEGDVKEYVVKGVKGIGLIAGAVIVASTLGAVAPASASVWQGGAVMGVQSRQLDPSVIDQRLDEKIARLTSTDVSDVNVDSLALARAALKAIKDRGDNVNVAAWAEKLTKKS
jgi:hypothetical protein